MPNSPHRRLSRHWLASACLLLSTPVMAESFQATFRISGLAAPSAESPYANGDAFVFRHVRHAEEGWADLVVAKTQSAQSVTDEVTYRQAAQDAGLDSYFTQVTSWRCDEQDFGPDVVPEVERGCEAAPGKLFDNYVLDQVPKDFQGSTVFAVRYRDREYGVNGNGHWLMECPIATSSIQVGQTTLEQLVDDSLEGPCIPTYQTDIALAAGDWILGADPATNKR